MGVFHFSLSRMCCKISDRLHTLRYTFECPALATLRLTHHIPNSFKVPLSKINKIENANAAYLKFLFWKFSMKTVNYSSHISFLKTCQKFGLTPRFIQFRINGASIYTKDKLSRVITKKWIAIKLRKWYGLLNSTTKLVYLIHSRMSHILDPEEFDLFYQRIFNEKTNLCSSIKEKKNKKVRALMTVKQKCNHQTNQENTSQFNYGLRNFIYLNLKCPVNWKH